ncbi:hypothetical protein [Shewanella algae]|uniref:hypothetical protein n=1 Tax=Shewanella algae TaxID=38313 RepID=UPI000D1BF133|nr:hypothetical protein [Shewanella algae]PSS74074.1 hypothetical protein AYI88_05205 [Shewanella algae]
MKAINWLLYALLMLLSLPVVARYYLPAKLAGLKATWICRRHFGADLRVSDCRPFSVGGELVPRKGRYNLELYSQTLGEYLNLYQLKREEISVERLSQARAKQRQQAQAERARLKELSDLLGGPLWLFRHLHANELHQQQLLLVMPPEGSETLTPWLQRLTRLLLDNPDCCAYLIPKERQANLASELAPTLLPERLGDNVRLKLGLKERKLNSALAPYQLFEARACLKIYRPRKFGKLQPETQGIVPQTLSLDSELLSRAFPSLVFRPLPQNRQEN